MQKRFGFLLARNFTLSPLSLFIDTLRLAGDEGDRSRRIAFDWQIIGDAGLPMRASCGLELMPTARIGHPEDYDNIVVVGGLLDRQSALSPQNEAFLMLAARKNIPITALCTGSFVLARYGLLDSYRASVSWFHIRDFRTHFPQVQASADALFVVDRDRATCSGGTGAADLAAHFVSASLGEKPAVKAGKILILDRIRSARDVQPVNDMFPNATSATVRRALLMMESNLQQPLSIADIARAVGRSNRQLERLFATELGTSPRQAYMTLRIHTAAGLVSSGDLPIGDVGYEAGFINATHFSRAFRKYAGLSPSELRKDRSR